MHSTRFLRVRSIVVATPLVLSLAHLARADGPPPRSLSPAPASVAADSLEARALAEFDAAAYRAGRESRAGHPIVRNVALASALGFAGLALWRHAVADDRQRDYEGAIFPESAARFRESVRDAERERNLFAALSSAGFTLVVLSFVY